MPSSSDIVQQLSYANARKGAYIAVEFDLALGERTGQQMVFDASSMADAARKLAYALNLSSPGWHASRSGRTVKKVDDDMGWNLVKAESPAAKSLGEEMVERDHLEEPLVAEEAEPLEGKAYEEDEEEGDEGGEEDEDEEEESTHAERT
jgi:hypothetical protein